MKSRSLLWIFALLLTAISPVIAQDDSADDPLLRLLRYVPDTPESREFVQYGDPALWYDSWEVERPVELRTIERPNASEVRASNAFIYAMPEQVLPPEALGIQYVLLDEMQPFYGFDLLSADRWLQAGDPPDWMTVVEVGEGLGAEIETALAARGYATADAEGATLYSMGDDYEVMLGTSDVPRVGQLGNLNRIAVAGDTLVISKATAIATSALEAAVGHSDSLAAAADYQALAAALNDPALAAWPDLVGVTTAPSATFSVADPATFFRADDPEAALEQFMVQFEDAPTLPVYMTAAFATKHGPGESAYVLALVFPPGTDAQASADAVAERFELFPSTARNQPFADLFADFSLTVEQAVGVEAAGLPVALVVLTQPDPDLRHNPLEPRPFSWMRVIAQRDTLFLIPSDGEAGE